MRSLQLIALVAAFLAVAAIGADARSPVYRHTRADAPIRQCTHTRMAVKCSCDQCSAAVTIASDNRTCGVRNEWLADSRSDSDSNRQPS